MHVPSAFLPPLPLGEEGRGGEGFANDPPFNVGEVMLTYFPKRYARVSLGMVSSNSPISSISMPSLTR